MADVLVKPAFQSAVADSGDATKLGPTAWNAARLFSGGADGEILIRSGASATGAAWSAAAALTGLPAAGLTGTLPDDVFPAVLPAVSGANLTTLPLGETAAPKWVQRSRVLRVIDNMESGWSRFSATGTATHAAGEGMRGSGAALKLVSDGTGFVSARPASGYSVTKDVSNTTLGLWVKKNEAATFAGLTLYVYSNSFAAVKSWNVSRPLLINEWVFVTVNLGDPDGATGVLNETAVDNVQLRMDVTGAGATVWVSGLVVLQKPAAAGAVSIVFDDSWSSVFTAARPAMDVYGYAGTCYNIIENIGTAQGYTLAQAQQLHQLHGWEMAAHAWSFDYHPPGPVNTASTDADLHRNFRSMRRWLVEQGFGGGADHYAYPQGALDARVLAVVRQHFASARCGVGFSEPYPPGDPHRLRCMEVTNVTAVATVTARIDQAVAGKHWLILLFHHIVPAPTVSTQYSTVNFAAILSHLNSSGAAVRTVGDVLKHKL